MSRNIRAKAEIAWHKNALTSYVKNNKSQGWNYMTNRNVLTNYVKNNKSQGCDSMTNRNALTNYGMIRIKAEKAWQAEMHSHSMKQWEIKAESGVTESEMHLHPIEQ